MRPSSIAFTTCAHATQSLNTGLPVRAAECVCVCVRVCVCLWSATHVTRHAKDGVVAEAGHGERGLVVSLEPVARQRAVNQRLELLVLQVLHAVEAARGYHKLNRCTDTHTHRHSRAPDSVGGEDAGAVGVAGLDEAVGGEEDGAGEHREFKLLQLPRAAEVAHLTAPKPPKQPW